MKRGNVRKPGLCKLCYYIPMSKETWIIILGAATVLLPQLGIPGSWRTLLLTLCGGSLVALGFVLRGEALSRGGLSRRGALPFVENEHTDGIASLN